LIAQVAIVARAPVDTSQGVNFHALLMPDTVYVGQQATYQVGVFIDDRLRQRLRHNPEFIPPDPQGMLAYDITGSGRVPAVRHAGARSYEVHVFERAFFPLAPGQYEIPSAQLVYSLPLSMSFFSREETHTLVAESLRVVVRPPPLVGRPADFNGAVGALTVASHLDSAAGRVGDPMLLTLSVAGRGDVKLFPRPSVSVPWGSAVAAQERVHLDTTTDVVSGSKDFDWLVTPRDSGDLAVPSIRYPYFNPYTERYEIAETGPRLVHVAPGALAAADTGHIDLPAVLSIRTAYRGAGSPPLYQSPAFLILLAGGPAPAVFLAWRRRPKRSRRRRAPSAASRLSALAHRARSADAVTVRRLYVRALIDRFGLGPTAFTDAGALAHALRLEGVTAGSAEAAEGVLKILNRSAFAPDKAVLSDVSARANTAYEAVIAEARAPGALRASRLHSSGSSGLPLLAIVALLLGGGAAQAIGRETVQAREFSIGVSSYAKGDFGAAATHFAAVTQLAPRAPDGWANAGTAAWATGDTTDAVVGWQRAGRLEPQATDVRDRLALVRAPQDGPIARLPDAPPSWLANAALACWLLGWGIAAYHLGRGFPAMSAAPLVCVAAALVAGWLAVLADERAAARRLATVEAGSALFASPALDAERLIRLDAGDIALEQTREGVWAHIRLDDDREGWIETSHLISLERIAAAPKPAG
jgi:hypothetical protein